MNEISKSANLNSIEEFRACYEQELKEILEELNNNGVTNIEGVEDIIKLFFDEYYQYLSIELSSDRELYEVYQHTMYALTERKLLLSSFTDVITSEFYNDVLSQISFEISKLESFSPKYNDRYESDTASNARIYTNEEYQKKEEFLQRDIWSRCAGMFRIWYLEKKISTLHQLLLGNNDKVAIGSIVYNGHLKQMEGLLNECAQCNALIIKFGNEIKALKDISIIDLNAASLNKISYHLPSNLFSDFNPYVFNVLCDGVYLNNTDMSLSRTGRYKSFTQKKREEIGTSETKRIGKEQLEEYLNSLIEIKSFWKEKVIDDFLKICIVQLTGLGPGHLRLGIKSLFSKSIVEEIQRLRTLINSTEKGSIFSKITKYLPKSDEAMIDELIKLSNIIFKNDLDGFNKNFCYFYHPEIYSLLESFLKANNLRLECEYLYANSSITPPSKINESREKLISFLKANLKQIKNDILAYLESVESLRIKLAMEIFGLTKEKFSDISNEELEKKYQDLLNEVVEKLKQARERLATNKKNSMQAFIPQFILESSKTVDTLNSNIEQLRQKIKEKEEEIRNLTDRRLNVEALNASSLQLQEDNSELHLYILNKLIHKYRPLIEPMIKKNSSERENALLANAQSMTSIVPFNLAAPYNDTIPVIGPAITKN